MGAHHVYPGVNSREQYLAWHTRIVAGNKAAYPNMPWGDPHVVAGSQPELFVAGGVARIDCPECASYGAQNVPAVWIDGRFALACCVECGAIYDRIAVPETWAAIEAALIRRQQQPHRYWNPVLSVEQLIADNERGAFPLVVEG